MRDYQLLVRRLRPHRGVMLLALVVFAATGYVACSGEDRVFGGNGGGGEDDSSAVSDGTGADVEDDTNQDDTINDTQNDTQDDTVTTNH